MKKQSNNLTLIIGGARSGKSDFAVRLTAQKNKSCVIYIATMEAKDKEMKTRIEKHRKKRPKNWITVEEPVNIAKEILKYGITQNIILLDCLTLFLSNLILKKNSASILLKKIKEIISTINKCNAEIIIVTNEVGQGIVPDNFLARQFRDIQGTANQMLTKAAAKVYWMVAGIPIEIK